MLDFPDKLSQIHDSFHVSQLRKYVVDETAVVSLEDIQVDGHLSYVDRPIAILDWKSKTLQNKVMRLVKVQ